VSPADPLDAHVTSVDAWTLWGVPLGAIDALLAIGGSFGVVVIDRERRVRWARQPEGIYRTRGVALVGATVADLEHPAADVLSEIVEEVLLSGNPADMRATPVGTQPEGFLPVQDERGDLVAVAHVWAAGRPPFAGDATDQFRGLEQELLHSRRALQLALQAGRMGTWSWDRVSNIVTWDEMLCAIYGVDAGPSSYEDYVELIHPDDRDDSAVAVRSALEQREGYVVVHRILPPEGGVRWVEGRGDVVIDTTSGEVTGIRGVTMDVTERERASARLRRLAANAEVLATAGVTLAATLDPDAVLTELAHLAVPALADGCEVSLLQTDGSISRLVYARGVDQERLRRRELTAIMIDDHHPIAEVLRTGSAQRIRVSDDIDGTRFGPADDDTSARSFGVDEAVVVPLRVRNEVIGALALGIGASGRVIDDDLIDVANELAARAALCYDNARLFSEQQAIAQTLQHSLLPRSLPDVPWLDLAARYWVPGTGAVVGGDFYEVVVDPNDPEAVTLVIGDVCGKGIDAARLTALARYTLRAALDHTGDLSAALRWLHDALISHDVDSFVTVALARVTKTSTGATAEVAVGGHPRPIVVHRDGTASLVDAKGTAPGLPIWQDAHGSQVDLVPDDVLLLYTDGVTDVPGDAALSPEELLDIVTAFGGQDADQVATSLGDALAALRPQALRIDDTALLAARVRAVGTG
jgi:PAS domain S-box-containing protein